MTTTIRTRRLPHFEAGGGTYFVTFRLHDTLPRTVLASMEQEYASAVKRLETGLPGTDLEAVKKAKFELQERIENFLDQGHGRCWLKDERVAKLVVDAVRYFDRERYLLHAWCVMPNHVHVVFSTIDNSRGQKCKYQGVSSLQSILHSWKSFSAKEANKILSRDGNFWQREYYDHLIRDDSDLLRCVRYTIENPVKANLCDCREEWPWTGLGPVEI